MYFRFVTYRFVHLACNCCLVIDSMNSCCISMSFLMVDFLCLFRVRQQKLRQDLEDAARENIQILPEKYE